MFERNRVETQEAAKKTAVPVELTLDDGRFLKGRFIVSKSRSIYDVLNGPVAFLEFETYQGDCSLISKSSIRDIRLVGVPAANQLNGSAQQGRDTFDPYAILGVHASADYDRVREAFHQLSKVYHPDRYSTADLPEEVQSYLSAMSRRVNAAYAAISEPLQVKRQVAKNKVEPIYTSASGRATQAVS
ncbi:MAG: J domain-containing protein [Pseudomonadota bacterium]